MKIAYLANVRIPSEKAHATQIVQMCEAFEQIGCKPTLFVNKRPSEPYTESYGYQVDTSAFRIKRLFPSRIFPKLKFTFYVGEMIFALHFLCGKNAKQFDVIYCRSEWILFFLLLFIPSNKLVWESHEAKFTFPARRVLKSHVRCVCISDGIKNFYIDKGFKAGQFLVAHDGIDETFFTELESKKVARKRLTIDTEKSVVMYIGGLEDWKGVDTFCAAAAICQEALFVVIGGSQALVMNFQKKFPTVKFLGALPYSDLPNNQQAADVLVVPNSAKIKLSALYTSPLKLFAHMASGVPLVVSNVPSLTSVTGKKSVTIFEPDNPNSLADSLSDTLENMTEKRAGAETVKKQSYQYLWTERANQICKFISV